MIINYLDSKLFYNFVIRLNPTFTESLAPDPCCEKKCIESKYLFKKIKILVIDWLIIVKKL